MSRLQWISLGAAAALFSLLYFGLDTVPPEKKGSASAEGRATTVTTVDVLIREAQPDLNDAQRIELEELERQLAGAEGEARETPLRQLSATWYRFGFPAIAGHFAQLLAEEMGSAEAWSVAGTTFTIGLQRAREEKVRKYCVQNAVASFEKAISLEPEVVAHRLNLALVYTEQPPAEEPMRGILMLRDLNQKYPDNVPVINNLARLALQTGQNERALERLQRAETLSPDNQTTLCLLAEAYGRVGEDKKADLYRQKCRGQRN